MAGNNKDVIVLIKCAFCWQKKCQIFEKEADKRSLT